MRSVKIFRMRRSRLIYTVWCLLLGVLLFVWRGGSSESRGSREELSATQGDSPQSDADWFTPPSCCPDCTNFSLVGGLAGGLLSLVGVCAGWKYTKSKVVLHIFSAKTKDLVEKNNRLLKQSKKTQEELNAWAAVLSPSTLLKSELSNQREEFRLQLEEIEREREENKEKVQSVEKEITESEKEKATDKTEGYLREKHNLLQAQWKLEKRKEELEKQQLNVEKLLQKTEGMMATMTERKEKVQNHMELIRSHLEEVESQHDKAHRH